MDELGEMLGTLWGRMAADVIYRTFADAAQKRVAGLVGAYNVRAARRFWGRRRAI